MEDIIAPVPKELLKAELTEDKRLRFTHRSDNEIYIVTAFDSPNVMREIGRLREIAFRAAGGGTGKSLDIDEFDTMDVPYKQLVVWNPECNDISAVTAIFGARKYSSMRMVSLAWRQPMACSVSRRSSSTRCCLIPWSLAAHS